MRKLFTSESVTEGHPDKMCDQISDAILDELLKQDKNSRVACETTVNTGYAMIMGEISTDAYVDISKIAREVICDIGYDGQNCFDGKNCAILTSIDQQSGDIALGVDKDGAGDQGLMFGYACNETPQFMPMPVQLAHELAMRLTEVRKSCQVSFLRPDGKTQVTVEYEDDKPIRVDTIVISTQHNPYVDNETLNSTIRKEVIEKTIPSHLIDENTKIYINPTGRFVIGGPQGDSGLTGRKIMVDTYGGYARHGGGAFSGKDPTKVDRSAAYMARYLAKNIVASGLAERCEIQLAYAIGMCEPVSIMVDTFGTGKVCNELIVETIKKNFNLTPKGIIEKLDLKKPIYRKTASYGHFGRDIFPWEKTDSVNLFSNLNI